MLPHGPNPCPRHGTITHIILAYANACLAELVLLLFFNACSKPVDCDFPLVTVNGFLAQTSREGQMIHDSNQLCLLNA